MSNSTAASQALTAAATTSPVAIPISTLRGSFRRTLGIAWMEWKLLVRSPLYRIAILVCWALAVLVVHGVLSVKTSSILTLPDSSDLCAEALNFELLIFAPTLVALVAASSAGRERRPGIPETLFTTPPTSEEFVLGKFLAVVMATLALLITTLVVGFVWLITVEGIAGKSAPFVFMGMGWWKPLLIVACLGYGAGLMLPGASGGAVVFAYLVSALIATPLISPLFDLTEETLSPGYLLLGLGLVLVAALRFERARRGWHREQAIPIAILTIAAFGGGFGILAHSVATFETPPFHLDRALERLGNHPVSVGSPLPPFRLMDTQGHPVTPQTLQGRPTIFVFLTRIPTMLGALPRLRALVAANAALPEPRVRIILVFYSPDPAIGARWGESFHPPIPVINQPLALHRPVIGLAPLFGLDFRSLVLGEIAVLDRNGIYLGHRTIYEITRPPALLSLLNLGASTATDEDSHTESLDEETHTAGYFLRALREYQAPGR